MCSLGWDFSLEMALLHPGVESHGVLTMGLLGVGWHVQWHNGMAGGLGRLHQGQAGIVYHEKPTSNMKYEIRHNERWWLQEVSGLSVLLRQVEKSTRVEGQIFISLFLPCLVRPWRLPLAKAACLGGHGPGQKVSAGGAVTARCCQHHAWSEPWAWPVEHGAACPGTGLGTGRWMDLLLRPT